MILELLQLH